MAFFDFLGDAFKGIGNFGADADQFIKREMPFDSGWGAPAAAVAAHVGAPYIASSLGAEGAGALGGATDVGTTAGSGGFMDGFGSLFGGSDGGFGIGQGANYTNFANTSGGSFGNINPIASPSGSEFGLNFGSPSSIASSNSAMGLSNLSPSGTSGNDLLKQLMQSQQKTAQQNQGIFDTYQPTQVTRQAAFLPTPGMVQVQDKQSDLAALIKALRG
jgi:hypothetical protein